MRRADSFEKTLMLGLGAGGEGDSRGWDGWMATLTQWTWVWVNSRSWWWTRRTGVLWFMGSQRVRHNWANELSWMEYLENCHDRKYVTYLALHILTMTYTYIFHINVAVWCKGKHTGQEFRKILLHYQVVMWSGINHSIFLDFIFIFHIMRWLVRLKFHLYR